MKYGYFDDANYEYVIQRPDTPAPWVNYLGDPNYGAIISNNAGGYSFSKSGANGRILRYQFNSFDEPGRYIYIKDKETNDYWTSSWRPVLKDLSDYSCECRHGLAYSQFTTKYSKIVSNVTYYVPLNQNYEIWHVRIKNTDNKARQLSVTGYCEFTNDNNYEQDLVNLQYSQFISKTEYKTNVIRQIINPNFETSKPDECTIRYFALSGEPVTHYCGDKSRFLGNYHNYSNPIGIINGLDDSLNLNNNSCGALQSDFTLAPDEEHSFSFIVAIKDLNEIEDIVKKYEQENQCAADLNELKSYWRNKLSAFHVHTPSPAFNSMINVWHAYNCFITFTWSRAASFNYCGLRNGYGYRDTVQDIQGIIHLDPQSAKEKIRFMLSAQVNNGAGLPLVKFTHKAGYEDTPDDPSYVKATGHPSYRADDALWLFPTIYKYIAETKDFKFLDETVPYANSGEDNVYNHLKKAIHFSLNHLGKHKMPAGLYADWNDCLRLGKEGESTFVLMQFYFAINILLEFALQKNIQKDIDWLHSIQEQYQKIIHSCYDEDRFIRGYTADGEIIGAKRNPEANLWLNPQSYAVIANACDDKTTETILNTVYNTLNTEYGAELMHPPFQKHLFEGALAACYAPGNKENGSIFQQTQGWLILAEALHGNGNRAFRYYLESCPANQNEHAEIRVMEPYVYGQFTEGRLSQNHGRSHVHWLTGTASTVMVACVEGILGIRPKLDGLHIEPALPDEWDSVEIEKTYLEKKLYIHLINNKQQKKIVLNDKDYSGSFIKESDLKDENKLLIYC